MSSQPNPPQPSWDPQTFTAPTYSSPSAPTPPPAEPIDFAPPVGVPEVAPPVSPEVASYPPETGYTPPAYESAYPQASPGYDPRAVYGQTPTYEQPAVYDQPGAYEQPMYPQQYGAYPQAYPGQEYSSYPPVPDPYAAPYMAPPYAIGYNPAEKNSLGTTALVLGIVSFCCVGLFAGVPAIVLGIQGRAAADQGRATNKSMATAGLVLGVIGTVVAGLYWILVMILPSL